MVKMVGLNIVRGLELLYEWESVGFMYVLSKYNASLARMHLTFQPQIRSIEIQISACRTIRKIYIRNSVILKFVVACGTRSNFSAHYSCTYSPHNPAHLYSRYYS